MSLRGAFSYVKRVTQKKGKAEFAAKFISARGKRKSVALREMELLSELDYERILFFHDAFEKKNIVVLITELYPFHVTCYQAATKGALIKQHLPLPLPQHCFKFYLLHRRTEVHLNASRGH